MTQIIIGEMVASRRMFTVVGGFTSATFSATKEELVEMKKTLDLMIGAME
jgi:hypothetical protein